MSSIITFTGSPSPPSTHGSLLPSILTNQATTPVSDVQLHGPQTPLTAIAAAGDFATAATTMAVSTRTPSVSFDSNGGDQSSVKYTLASGDQASAEAPGGQNNDIISKLITRFDLPAGANYTTEQLRERIDRELREAGLRRDTVALDNSKQEQYEAYCTLTGRIAFAVSMGVLSLITFGGGVWMFISYRRKRALSGEMRYDWKSLTDDLLEVRGSLAHDRLTIDALNAEITILNAALDAYQTLTAENLLELDSSHREYEKLKQELARMTDIVANNVKKELSSTHEEGADGRSDNASG